jgi:hypothetical protein
MISNGEKKKNREKSKICKTDPQPPTMNLFPKSSEDIAI